MPERCKQALYRLPGYRILGEFIQERPKALQFRYYDWIIWVPRHAVVQTKDEGFTVPAWAIDTAKEHPSAMYGQEAEEFLYKRQLKKDQN